MRSPDRPFLSLLGKAAYAWLMFYTALLLATVAVVLVVMNGLNSSKLVRNSGVRWLVIVSAVIGAALSAAIIFETVWPAAALVEEDLRASGDGVALGHINGGVLYIECTANKGVARKGSELQVRMVAKGQDGLQKIISSFFLGDSLDEKEPKAENLAANVPLESLGADTQLKLTLVSPKDQVVIHVAYRPQRFPVRIALLILLVFTVLAGAYEGALPSSWRRTFLTASVSSVTIFGSLVESGFTVEDSVWTLWIRLAASVAGGAIIGTLLPAITGSVLPELEGTEGQMTESTES